MNEEQKDQQLDAAYRRASASEAGRPDAKTRAAILAEAAAAARRRTPAANESRYLMRAVAGLAVIGVGLLVWRQTDHRLPGEAQTFDVPVAQQSELVAESAYVPDPEAAPAQEVQEEPAPRQAAGGADPGVAEKSEVTSASAERAAPADRAVAADRAGAPAVEMRSASPSTLPPATAPPPPPPPAPIVSERAQAPGDVERSELQEVQVTGSRVQAPRRTVGPRNTVPAPAAGASSAAQDLASTAPSAEDLLREHFPEQYQSPTPRRVWLVRDAGGRVLRTGELAPGQQLDGQLASIRQSLDARELVVESVQSLRNARDQLIELTLLRAR